MLCVFKTYTDISAVLPAFCEGLVTVGLGTVSFSSAGGASAFFRLFFEVVVDFLFDCLFDLCTLRLLPRFLGLSLCKLSLYCDCLLFVFLVSFDIFLGCDLLVSDFFGSALVLVALSAEISSLTGGPSWFLEIDFVSANILDYIYTRLNETSNGSQ